MSLLIRNNITFYLQNTEIICDGFAVFGMFIHTYFYQKWDKHAVFNPKWEVSLLWVMMKLMFFTDLFELLAKKKSIVFKKGSHKDIIVYDIIHPIVLFLIQIIIFKDITIEGYKQTFLIMKILLMSMNSCRIILVFHKRKFISDLVKLVNTVWIINLMLIILTDPAVNTPERNKLVVFYEVYFRYLESYILILVFYLLRNYANIENEIIQKIYTTSVIIGKKDTYRMSVILIFGHYYFPLVNGIAYSLKYWIGFTSMIPAFYCIDSFRQKKMIRVQLSFVIVILWNLGTYLIALYYSAPNVGDGSQKNK